MEISTITSFTGYFEKIRERTRRLVLLIPPEQIDWSYLPGKFSLGDIARHIAATERWMFAENIQGKPSLYHGCGKDLADGLEAIVSYLDDMHDQSMTIFNKLKNEDLFRKCQTPAGHEITAWKWLRAMLEHEIHHRGQLYLYLNMLNIKTPPIFGLSEEELKQKSNTI